MDEAEYLFRIGQNIRKIRRSKHLKLTEFGFMCGIEKSNLIPIEKGRVNVTALTLRKIADALDVQVSDFFQFDDENDTQLQQKRIN